MRCVKRKGVVAPLGIKEMFVRRELLRIQNECLHDSCDVAITPQELQKAVTQLLAEDVLWEEVELILVQTLSNIFEEREEHL